MQVKSLISWDYRISNTHYCFHIVRNEIKVLFTILRMKNVYNKAIKVFDSKGFDRIEKEWCGEWLIFQKVDSMSFSQRTRKRKRKYMYIWDASCQMQQYRAQNSDGWTSANFDLKCSILNSQFVWYNWNIQNGIRRQDIWNIKI